MASWWPGRNGVTTAPQPASSPGESSWLPTPHTKPGWPHIPEAIRPGTARSAARRPGRSCLSLSAWSSLAWPGSSPCQDGGQRVPAAAEGQRESRRDGQEGRRPGACLEGQGQGAEAAIRDRGQQSRKIKVTKTEAGMGGAGRDGASDWEMESRTEHGALGDGAHWPPEVSGSDPDNPHEEGPGSQREAGAQESLTARDQE